MSPSENFLHPDADPMEKLPEQIEEALVSYKRAVIERKSISASLYLRFKREDESRNSTEIKALVESHPDWIEASLKEAIAEGHHIGLYEKLMTLKKISNQRTAY